VLTLRFRLYAIRSIKEKRSIVKRLIADVHRCGPSFAACEAGDQDDLGRLTLSIAHLSGDGRFTDSALSRVRARFDRGDGYEIIDSEFEIL